MTTLKELIYNIRMQIKDYKSDDIKLTDRHIEFLINYIRIKLIRQDVQKNRYPSSNYEQTIPNVELKYVDASGSDLIYTGSRVLVSEIKIPKMIDVDSKILLTAVTGIDNTKSIDVVSMTQARKRRQLKYAKNRMCAYYHNDRIYIQGCPSELRYVSVTGVFEDPRELSTLTDFDGNSLFDVDNDKYPISGHMIDMLNSIIKHQELDLYLQIADDKINDGQNNI